MNQSATKPVRVCFYVRVSSDKQAGKEDGSLDTQLDRLAAYVNYKNTCGDNWTITERLVEGERDGKRRGRSAKDMNREAVQHLIELAEARLIDVVMVTKIDRISRSTIDFLMLVQQLTKCDVKLVSLREQIDLTTPAGRFQTTLLIALAEHERELISVRTKEKVEWRAEKGLPIGPPPIGYRMEKKMYVIDEGFAKHVRSCDRLYLERESSDEVVREFARLGFRTPRGKRYNLPMICRILRNPTYTGKIEYQEKVYEAQWKAIRAWETHQKIQTLMDANNRRKRREKREKQDHVYVLQGLLRCGICEHKMVPKPGMGRGGKYYPYYACTNAEKSLGGACPRNYVPAETVDRAVMAFLKKLELKPELVRNFVQQANEMVSDTGGKLKEDLKRVQERLIVVRSKLDNLAEAVAESGKSALPVLGKKMEALEAERGELEQSEGRLKKEIEAETSQVISAQEQIRTLGLFRELVDMNETHPERIRAMLPRFVDYVVWREEKGEGNLEVALFPRPFVTSKDETLKLMLKDLIERRWPAEERGSDKLSVRPRLSIGVTDGI